MIFMYWLPAPMAVTARPMPPVVLSTVKTVTDVAVARDALQRADAGTYLRHCGDIFITGPTNTNVMDLAIAVVS